MKVIQFTKRPKDYLGQSIKVFLKDRANDQSGFHFKVTAAGPDHISGYDDEFMELTIAVADIDYIIGG